MKKYGIVALLATFSLVACGPEAQNQISRDLVADTLTGPTVRADFSGTNPIHSMVLISRKGSVGIGFCGGLLIAKNKVLTALHCISDTRSTDGLSVVFPNKDKKASTSTSTFSFQKSRKAVKVLVPDAKQILPGTNVHNDRDYNSGTAILDLAVIVLEGDAPDFVPVFNPANLATQEDLRQGKLSAFGWNSDDFENNGADYKNLIRQEDKGIQTSSSSLMERFFTQEKEMKEYCTMKPGAKWNEDCHVGTSIMRKIYGTQADSFKILTTSSNKVCKGDSGSPLFVITPEGKYKLLGVASSGLALEGRLYEKMLTGITECSPHTFYQGVPALKNWLASVLR